MAKPSALSERESSSWSFERQFETEKAKSLAAQIIFPSILTVQGLGANRNTHIR